MGNRGAASGVAPVTIDPNAQNAAGPVGVARIVYFDYDSYTVKPEYQSLIDGHARFLKANPQRRVSIEGHTDDRGGREYNLALGQKRSEAVRRALNLLGVSDNQVEAVSFGKEKPAVQGTGESAFAQNRRAEVTYR
jgi:peptidoglycan-associated lipoprotein